MKITKEHLTPTHAKLTIVAGASEIADVKQKVLDVLGANVKVAGFRAGKAPAKLVEQQIDQSALQTEFLETAVNQLLVAAVEHEKLRAVSQPNVAISKFVPFTTLEFTAELAIVGDIKLADYKKIKLAPKKITVTAKDVNEVIENLRDRSAEKQVVKRAAKLGDEVVIDFNGIDAKTKEPIAGGSGTDYSLQLGSKTFIPGFEDKLVGQKADQQTEFTLTFPKDYGVTELQNRKVTFSVTIKTVNELAKPKLDDSFAAGVGPFKTLAELKSDIKKQLEVEKQREAQTAYDNEILAKIADKSTIPVPDELVDSEIDRMEEEEKRNLTYRGQTWQEHLDTEGVTAEEHRERQKPQAEQRVKAGLVLAEIADREEITATPEELEVRIMLLKNQYTDEAMLAELDKPENRRDVRSRLLTEKTLDKIRSYSTT